jgi:hypothetical protein
MENNEANNLLQGTRHKVARPLKRDVRQEMT